MNEQRGNLYLLTGLVIGLAFGLLIAWVISPVKYVDTEPSTLAPAVKDEYRKVIAMAYQANPDLERARQRIDLVDPGSSYQALAAQAQRMLAEDTASQEARALALLAAAMSNSPVEVAATPFSGATAESTNPTTPQTPVETALGSAETPAEVAAIQSPTPLPTATHTPSPTPTFTPAPTFTPRPTATPKRALESPFILKQKREICDKSVTPGLLQIQVTGSDGKPLPGVQITMLTKDGQDSFFTGFYPEIGPGYADFVMSPGEVYSLKVGDVSEIEEGIAIPICGGGLLLEFEEGKR